MVVPGVAQDPGLILAVEDVEGMAFLLAADHPRLGLAGSRMGQIHVPEVTGSGRFGEEPGDDVPGALGRFFPINREPAPEVVREGHARNALESRLAHRRDRPRDGEIVPAEIAAVVDPREDPVGCDRQEMGEGNPDAVGRSAVDGKGALAPPLVADRRVGGHAMPDLRHLRGGRHHPDFVEEGLGDAPERGESVGVDAVVVGEQGDHKAKNTGFGFCSPPREGLCLSRGDHARDPFL